MHEDNFILKCNPKEILFTTWGLIVFNGEVMTIKSRNLLVHGEQRI